MTAPGTDKRKGKPRVWKRLSVRFGTEAKMIGGNVVEISEGGMRIESTESFPVHSVITVFVQFPRHSVRLRARVIWSGGSSESSSTRMGLALTQPEPALKLAYAEWAAEVKKAASEAHMKHFDHLLVIGFAIEPSARTFVEKVEQLVGIPATYVQATPDLVRLSSPNSGTWYSVGLAPDSNCPLTSRSRTRACSSARTAAARSPSSILPALAPMGLWNRR